MRIADLLTEDRIAVRLRGRSKEDVLREMADQIASGSPALERNALYGALLDRESTASTGIGEGVAIPHTKIAGAETLMIAVGVSREGVEFGSIDGQPAHIFVVLVAPEHCAGDHLKALARVSRLCRDSAFRGKLLVVETPHVAFELIATEDARHG